MKKAVLFLINGFGIEKKDSYSVYDEKALPTLDRMMKTNLYTSLESKANDYLTGYQLLSTGTLNSSNYSFLDQQIEQNTLINNPNLKQFNSENVGKESKIHIFLKLVSADDIEALNKFVKYLKIDINRIIIHIILTQTSLTEYKQIINLINNIIYSNFKSHNIGLIFGENCFVNPQQLEHLKTIERILYNSKSAEKWVEYPKRLNMLANNNILPIDIPPFCVNDDFSVVNDDSFIFFNFGKWPCDELIKGIINPQIVYKTVDNNTLKFYSLFPLETETKIINLLGNVQADEYLAKYLEKTNLNSVILTDPENLNIINYMVNGFSNDTTSRIKYIQSSKDILTNKEQLNAIINNYDLTIINTRIDNVNTINELKATLHDIDTYLSILENICQNKAMLIVSSLFGINKELQISNLAQEKATVNFYGSVPLIIAESNYSKEEYFLGYGALVNIIGTALKYCNPDSKFPTLIKKKGTLLKKIKEQIQKFSN